MGKADVVPSLRVSRSVPDDQEQAADDESSAAPSYTLGEITVANARKVFGVTTALNGCTLKARRGEIHAVVGENGSGKSTLAKALSGVLPLDGGSVSVFGESPTTPHAARSLGIATVFQEVLIADEASVVDNLFVGSDTLWTKSVSAWEKKDAAARVMEDLLGYPVDPDTVAGSLPLSTKQWITIARALLRDPIVLILDESSAALDLDATERLFEKMRQFRDAGAAVFIVTHRIAELVRISDRATVLRDGCDVGVLEKGEITENNLLGLMTGEAPVTSSADKAGPEPTSDTVVLKTDQLRVWASGNGINFTLREGEIVGVAGLDGQGQDEFVRVLSGIAPSVEGVTTVRSKSGEMYPIRGQSDAMAAGVSYVSGDRKLEGILPNLSIYENLLIPQYRRHRIGGVLALIQWDALSGAFDREVERLSIKLGNQSDLITSLSGGNQQKVMIGRSFAINSRILILNDPARGIDIGSKEEIYRQLREYASHGNSVIYLSSEIEEFIGLCSRVLVFRHGSMFAQFSGLEIDTHRILEAMFGQTSGGSVTSRDAVAPSSGFRPIKVLDFGEEEREMITKDDISPIKIKEFGRSEGPRSAPDEMETENRSVETSTGAHRKQGPREDSASVKLPRNIKIVDFDEEHAEQKLRQRLGPIKIVDVDKEAKQQDDREWERTREAHERNIGEIKIIESDA